MKVEYIAAGKSNLGGKPTGNLDEIHSAGITERDLERIFIKAVRLHIACYR